MHPQPAQRQEWGCFCGAALRPRVCVPVPVFVFVPVTAQKREAEQQAHDALVAQNQGLEREYQRFEKKQKLLKSIQVGRLLQPEDVV